jgi:PHD/YefM family antitoxin component YafN of YafNO toxin-antitoxin module
LCIIINNMKSVSATSAKQNFGAALALAKKEPVAIERHGKTVAVLVPANEAPSRERNRALARERQAAVEAGRLIRHQAIAIRLLKAGSEEASRLVKEALQRVKRWEDEQLCSQHFIDRWRELLALPVPEMAERMCGDMEGWGVALRQNSPWLKAA